MNLRTLRLKQETIIAASPEQVWAVFKDILSWPRWNSVCREVAVKEGKPWEPGFRFRMVLDMAGVPVPFEPNVIEADPPNRVVWRSTRLGITGTRTFTFELVDGMTQAADEKLFESRVMPVALVYPRPVIRRMSERWLSALAREVERRTGVI